MASGRTSIPQSRNRYSYVLNNSLRYVDPLGMEPQDPNDPKPDKNNQLINRDGKPYQLPIESVTLKVKLPKRSESIGRGGGSGAGIIGGIPIPMAHQRLKLLVHGALDHGPGQIEVVSGLA